MCKHVSLSNGDYRLAEEVKFDHAHQQVSDSTGQQKIVLNVEFRRRKNDFGWRRYQERFCGMRSDVNKCL